MSIGSFRSVCVCALECIFSLLHKCQMGVHIFDRKHNYEHERLNRIEEIPCSTLPARALKQLHLVPVVCGYSHACARGS